MAMQRLAFALAMMCVHPLAGAWAQPAWPTRSVKLIVPFVPGGPPDQAARIIGQQLQDKWGQPVIVENRPGGAGNIGAATVARSEADGYTVLVSSSAFPVNLTLFERPGYTLQEFQTVAVPVVTPNVFVAWPGLNQKTLPDFLNAAKTENFAYASPGIGTTPHLSAELTFRVINKLDIRHVPFGGGPPVALAVSSGQLPVGVVAIPSVLAQIKSGALIALASTTARRLPELPDVPTVGETGAGDVEAVTSVGFYLPARTPADIAMKINRDINEIVSSGALDKVFAAAGFTPMALDQTQAQTYIEDEMKKWGAVIKATGLKAE